MWSLIEKQGSISDETQHGNNPLSSIPSPQHRMFNSKSVIPGIYHDASSLLLDCEPSPSPSHMYQEYSAQTFRPIPISNIQKSVSSETSWNYTTCHENSLSTATRTKLKGKELIPLGLNRVHMGNMDSSVLLSTQSSLKERSKAIHVMDNPLRTQTPARITVLKLPPLERKTSLPGKTIIHTPT